MLDVCADSTLLQPSGDYSSRLVGYYEISGYRRAQSMAMRLYASQLDEWW